MSGVLVWRRLPADLETPVAAFLKLASGRADAFLLESVEGGRARGRYSVIGLAPDLVWRCRDGRAEIGREGAFRAEPGEAILSLRALLAESRLDIPDGVPPMAAGVFGYLGYEMAGLVERLPPPKPDALDLPDALLLRPGLLAVFDHVRDELTLAAPAWGERPDTAAAERRLDAAEAALCAPVPTGGTDFAKESGGRVDPVSNFAPGAFAAAVETAREHIFAGDAFQIVPSQRFRAKLGASPFAFYRALRRVNPAPFLFFFDFGGFAVAGASPEILVRARDGVVTIRPLAGTRPRGGTREADLALEAALLADPKERAEHLMLVDLGRNDVGRVAALGSVRVTESFAVERFSHVMHISSTVEGMLRPDRDALDALLAGFPAGTLTGAPKVRAMEIIAALEPERRGVYGGCVGYFGADGGMDTCIALRTAVIRDGVLYAQAGAGVVADSDPAAEEAETRQKARALFAAAALAEGGGRGEAGD